GLHGPEHFDPLHFRARYDVDGVGEAEEEVPWHFRRDFFDEARGRTRADVERGEEPQARPRSDARAEREPRRSRRKAIVLAETAVAGRAGRREIADVILAVDRDVDRVFEERPEDGERARLLF